MKKSFYQKSKRMLMCLALVPGLVLISYKVNAICNPAVSTTIGATSVFTNASSLSSNNYTGTVAVKGTLVIDVNTFTFDGAVVSMEQGATIIVNVGKTLSIINSSHFKSCDGVNMWEKITVDAYAFVNIISSTIEDAKIAVELLGATGADIRDNIFNRNNTGVYLKAAYVSQPHSGILRGNYFSCENPLGTKIKANLLAPFSSSISAAGVLVTGGAVSVEVAGSTLPARFYNQQFGIKLIGSSAIIKTADFESCSGVFIGKYLSLLSPTIIEFCNFNLESNLNVGITGLIGPNRNLTIRNNSFMSFGRGISLRDLPGSTITISNNVFNQPNCSPVPNNGRYGELAIFVANLTKAVSNVLITGNDIRCVVNGIFVQNVDNARINTNEVYYDILWVDLNTPNSNFPGGSKRHQGITFQNCSGYQIVENTVRRPHSGATSSYNNGNNEDRYMWAFYGLQSQSSIPINRLRDNYAYNMTRGTFIEGNNLGTIFQCHHLIDCANGIYLREQNASISAQWVGMTTISNHYNHWTTNGLDPADIDRRVTGNNALPITWFFSGAGNSGNVLFPAVTFCNNVLPSTGFAFSVPCSPLNGEFDINRDALLSDIVNNRNEYTYYSTENRWYECNFAYRMLFNRPEWLNTGLGDLPYQEFYDHYSNLPLGQFCLADKQISEGNFIEAEITLSLINPDNTIEDNRKTAMLIYLEVFANGDGELTEAQRNTLLAIAQQHFMTGGDGVLMARAMLDLMINDSNIEENLRLASKENITHQILIVPNPAKESITLMGLENYERFSSLQITDQLGQQLFYQELDDKKEIKVLLPNLKSSVYFLTLNGYGDSYITKKLVVLK